ncbi:hypothetical protein [Perigonia lusca single nucleopolyhedrovirus]|uniref:Ac55 n=1 Tax=Perigonia lusca single nucleopolyhedrovirus TaxID=1675865 RepID=A0A0M3N1Z7_9ABAC|nr:hypothetical protein [Perigonia lusca single nucleopolyhedrovirus]AKN80634.1 hypothetical protein [Perigonia lusca single nucleopolyhedrovirus]
MANSNCINFKLSRVIDRAIVVNYNKSSSSSNASNCNVVTTTANSNTDNSHSKINLATFYAQYKEEDVKNVGRTTTYDIVGKRNYTGHFDEIKYKF